MKDWFGKVQFLVVLSFLCTVVYYGTAFFVWDMVELFGVFTFSDYINMTTPVMFAVLFVPLLFSALFAVWRFLSASAGSGCRHLERKWGRFGVGSAKALRLIAKMTVWLLIVAVAGLFLLGIWNSRHNLQAVLTLSLFLLVPLLVYFAFKWGMKRYSFWNVAAGIGAPLLLLLSVYGGYVMARTVEAGAAPGSICRLVHDGKTTETRDFLFLERGVLMVAAKGKYTLIPWDQVHSADCRPAAKP